MFRNLLGNLQSIAWMGMCLSLVLGYFSSLAHEILNYRLDLKILSQEVCRIHPNIFVDY
jgi:hypothetical protein